jgi:uncharacterized Zn finger protein
MTTRHAPSPAVVEKAGRYVAEGRVALDYADDEMCMALVRGSSDLAYTVQHIPSAGWRCSCPANRFQARTCAHILATWHQCPDLPDPTKETA